MTDLNEINKSELNKPLRIAQIVGKMKGGGLEKTVMSYFNHIDRSKVQFDFIVDCDSTLVPDEEITRLGGRIYRIPPYQRPFRYHRELVWLLRKNKYLVVHSHINTLSVFPLWAAKRAEVPVRIAHNHSTAGKGETIRNLIKYILRPFAKVFPTHLCACSKYAGEWIYGNSATSENAFKIMPIPIDFERQRFVFNEMMREQVRRSLGITDKLVVGHVGRFVTQKNHVFLLDIFHEIHKAKPDSVLLLVGEGDLYDSIKAKAISLGLSNHVIFAGIRNDVDQLYQAMDIFLLPSLYEGYGLVSIEAQISGLPLVASEGIPKEVKMRDTTSFLPLTLPASEWAKKVLELSEGTDRKYSTTSVEEMMRESIEKAEELTGWYLELAENHR
ncbi:hypothetical protein AT727_02635 [Desulfitobacterium hafniense]|uniref:Glycosyl transferase group 1 n=1 Tax=Desulfitobacterium hafniense TaxID=49338 RepID=A0A0W1JRE9_DESHA|nr:glycosyltransferase family 1 protein [Desulfitobacterium hafniense]KTE93870.1 hypothetical protein AT727_02635 [Desulfitobacterium hafniense]